MALLRRRRDPRATGVSPFKAGMVGILIIAVITFFGFTRYNPFKHPFELKAAVRSANNLQKNSPVRIAGVNIGKVKKVEPIKGSGRTGGGAIVTMEIEKPGLPIHKDAQLKIRPRIFLEGNFFVDIQPGTPTAPVFHTGDTVPIQQTSTPVQFGQLLTALQSDTRRDLQTLLYEYAVKGLGNGGAAAFNKGLDSAPGALRNSSIANDATLGQQPHDFSKLERGQQRLFHALSTNPAALKDLVVQLNTTAGAFAREATPLEQSIPLLRDTLRAATPALVSVDDALPTLRAFAREALPGTRSSGPTIDASLPLVTQLRLLFRKSELRGLVHDLRPTIPALARLNHGSVGLFNENRALSRCTDQVLVPFSKKPIPNPDEPQIDGAPFYKQSARGLVALSGESRINDAVGPVFHIQLGSGPSNTILTGGGKSFVAAAPSPPEGIRPIKSVHPPFRPGEPCELQQVPNLNAPRSTPDPTRTIPGSGVLPPLPKKFNQRMAVRGEVAMNQMLDYLKRQQAGQPGVDPMIYHGRVYLKKLKQLGLQEQPDGHVVTRKAGTP
jgi:phospholipid/cholesterol/gamma-HCH transport system substrate-binding protein